MNTILRFFRSVFAKNNKKHIFQIKRLLKLEPPTPNLGLVLPSPGDTNWGNTVNSAFDTIDTWAGNVVLLAPNTDQIISSHNLTIDNNMTIVGHIVSPLTIHGSVADFIVDASGGVGFSYLIQSINVNNQSFTNTGVVQLLEPIHGDYAYIKATTGGTGGGGWAPIWFAGKSDGSTSTMLIMAPAGAATSGTNYSSGSIAFNGSYWTGSVTATDQWQITLILGTGVTPTSTLTLSHVTGPGNAFVDASGASILGADFVRTGDPKYATYYDDFLVGPVGFGQFNVGTPSGANWYITDNTDPNHPGILRVNTGTISGSGFGYWNGNFGPDMGYPGWMLESQVEISSLTGGIIWGFFTDQVWRTTSGACYFVYDSSVNGNWHIQTMSNNYDTGISVSANVWDKLTMKGDGTYVYCYINGTLVKTLTNSIEGFTPGAGRFGLMSITNSSVAVYGDLDYVVYQRGPLSR